jgi:S-(hydroxymethyl)glutathione dehydrogenase/alcohol dehydrogenase
MRAAVLEKIPGELTIQEVEHDQPIGREVLIRTAAAGLCHSDLHALEGKIGVATPVVMGHESAGVVEAVGPDVDYVAPGDHVITCLSAFCGQCEYCLSGRPALCAHIGLTRSPDQRPRLSMGGEPCEQFVGLSSFAEHLLVHEHAVVRISEEMPLEKAALLGCGVTTGMGAVFRTAHIEPASTVAIIGCGGVGLSALQGAVISGARRVVAVDVNEDKLEQARRLGATDTIDATKQDPVAEVKGLFPGGPLEGPMASGVDYAFEAIGLKQTAEQAYQMTRKGGTTTLIGLPTQGMTIEIAAFDLLAGKKLQGSMMGSNRFRYDLPNYVEMYLRGQLKLDELISHELDLDHINDGFDVMRRAEGARSVVVF